MRNGHVRHGSYAMLHSARARCRHVALVILGPPAIIHARHASLSIVSLEPNAGAGMKLGGRRGTLIARTRAESRHADDGRRDRPAAIRSHKTKQAPGKPGEPREGEAVDCRRLSWSDSPISLEPDHIL